MKVLICTLPAALVLAACGSSASHPAAAPTTVASTPAPSSPAKPAGCDTAMVVVPAVRSGIENNSMTVDSAIKQLDSAAKQAPVDPAQTLRTDLDAAAFYLAQFNLQAAEGQAAGKWARRFAASLNKITRECGGG